MDSEYKCAPGEIGKKILIMKVYAYQLKKGDAVQLWNQPEEWHKVLEIGKGKSKADIGKIYIALEGYGGYCYDKKTQFEVSR